MCPHVVAVSAGHPRSVWRFLVIADEYPITRLRVEREVGSPGSMANPGLNDEISADACRVVPQVVSDRVHDFSLLMNAQIGKWGCRAAHGNEIGRA